LRHAESPSGSEERIVAERRWRITFLARLAKVDEFVAVLQIRPAQLAGLEDVVAAAKTAPNGSHACMP
jgi:hypothetical protein